MFTQYSVFKSRMQFRSPSYEMAWHLQCRCLVPRHAQHSMCHDTYHIVCSISRYISYHKVVYHSDHQVSGDTHSHSSPRTQVMLHPCFLSTGHLTTGCVVCPVPADHTLSHLQQLLLTRLVVMCRSKVNCHIVDSAMVPLLQIRRSHSVITAGCQYTIRQVTVHCFCICLFIIAV